MPTNADIARIFDEMAALLEITGANPFRIGAFSRVARAVSDMTRDAAEIAAESGGLESVEGIGEGSARRIEEFLKTGRIAEHQELLAKVPVGLLEVQRIPGLGPKTVKLLWEKAGVTDLASLKKALDGGRLAGLPRMGEKTIQNIRKAVAFAERADKRIRLGTALPLAETLVARLLRVEGTTRADHAGSLRRGRETIGDIDLLAATSNPGALADAFTSQEGVEQVLVAGSTKCSVRLARGVQVDLRIIDESAYGAALLYFTGSKDHNVRLRERAIKRKMRLNEYGLFPAGGDDEPDAAPRSRGVEPVAARTEAEIYKTLGLPLIPPELREDRGELELDAPPPLIEIGDIRAELHCHTKASDGRMTIDEIARAGIERGFHTIAITDHSRSSVQANGLSPERLLEHVAAIRAADERTDGITLLAGAEVDILVDGTLDYDDDVLAQLDFVVASAHASLAQSPGVATERLIRAIRHPAVHVLGHPTGRQIGRRQGLAPDMAAVIAAAVECGVALEINANPLRLDLRDTHVRAAVEAGALIAVDTDAHAPDQFDYLRYGVLAARRGWVTPERCVNTWDAEALLGWIRARRAASSR